jgi:hypothetical protein
MALKEIDILLRAADKSCAVVDKSSHVILTSEDLREASEAGCYFGEDVLGPPGEQCAISAPFPGCMQQLAAGVDVSQYRLIGQTQHFLIFAPP